MSRFSDYSTVAILTSLFLVGCSTPNGGNTAGSGKTASETRKLESYHAIKLNLPAQLTVDVGTEGKLDIAADDNILPHITTKVKDGQLEISSDQSIRNMKILTIKAQTAQLDALLVNGAANILINGLIGDRFAVDSNGASAIAVNGRIGTLAATLNGASHLQATKLAASRVTVKITGAGDADVSASNELDATTIGSGRIRYTGSATVTKKIIGAGVVEKMP
jgi:hypothetical protein